MEEKVGDAADGKEDAEHEWNNIANHVKAFCNAWSIRAETFMQSYHRGLAHPIPMKG